MNTVDLHCIMTQEEAIEVIDSKMTPEMSKLFQDRETGICLRNQVARTSKNGELICAAVVFARGAYELTLSRAVKNPAALGCMLHEIAYQRPEDFELLSLIAKNKATNIDTLAYIYRTSTSWSVRDFAHAKLLRRARGIL